MILVDTSVWIAHLRVGNSVLADLLDRSLVISHPFVIGELALGNIRRRRAMLDAMKGLPRAVVAADEEVLRLIEQHALSACGIGYVDAHLLVSTLLTAGTKLWTLDRRLHATAVTLKSAFVPAP